MIHTPAAVAVPLRTDENGVIRVRQTRVTLVTVINRYKLGNSAEVIHADYPTVPLSDVYAVIAYYLANRDTIDRYIQQIDEAAENTRKQWQARYTPEQQAHTEHLRQKLAETRSEQDS